MHGVATLAGELANEGHPIEAQLFGLQLLQNMVGLVCPKFRKLEGESAIPEVVQNEKLSKKPMKLISVISPADNI